MSSDQTSSLPALTPRSAAVLAAGGATSSSRGTSISPQRKNATNTTTNDPKSPPANENSLSLPTLALPQNNNNNGNRNVSVSSPNNNSNGYQSSPLSPNQNQQYYAVSPLQRLDTTANYNKGFNNATASPSHLSNGGGCVSPRINNMAPPPPPNRQFLPTTSSSSTTTSTSSSVSPQRNNAVPPLIGLGSSCGDTHGNGGLLPMNAVMSQSNNSTRLSSCNASLSQHPQQFDRDLLQKVALEKMDNVPRRETFVLSQQQLAPK